jgi:hypothetical protein
MKFAQIKNGRHDGSSISLAFADEFFQERIPKQCLVHCHGCLCQPGVTLNVGSALASNASYSQLSSH